MTLKNALVTGGSGGLGLSVVRRLLAEDWQVTVLVHSEAGKKRLAAGFTEALQNKRLTLVPGDATRQVDLDRVVTQMGQIDGLVHLVGGFKGGKNVESYNEADFQAMFTRNAFSTFVALKAVLPRMKKQKSGSIVAIAAKPALYPGGENPVYAASKAALTNLVLSAAEEGRAAGVRANVLVPYVIDTEENRQWAGEATNTSAWVRPEAMAGTIAWLLSPAGAAVTGTALPLFGQKSLF